MKEIHEEDCECVHCRGDKQFNLPDHLLEKIQKGEVVLFVGAGISTENPIHCKSTFYDQIRIELKIKEEIPFPQLMSLYCARPDGRIKLLEKIKSRFDYFISFSDFYFSMSRFHRAAAPLFMIQDIVTTNWDDFFERECGFDAFVYDSDLAFWDATDRRVMKIHGSITNFGSIIATEEDYRQSYRRLNDGPLGAQLKALIAKKTVIYSGYSLSDPNYLRLLRNISRMMGDNIRQSYFVAPSIDSKKLMSAPIPLIPIETDGAYFLEQVRAKFTDGKIIKEEAFDQCEEILSEIIEFHENTADLYLKKRHPLLVLALGYQDGLIHSLQRIKRMRKTGKYHSHDSVHGRIHAYEFKYSEFFKKKDFWNAAYAQGYQNGLLYLLFANDSDDPPNPPLFDLPFESKARSLSGICKISLREIPRVVLKQINRFHRSNRRLGVDLIPDHTPYL